MHFELWDLEVKNLLYDFDTLDEAVGAARDLTVLNPDRYPQHIALFQSDSGSGSRWLARGADVLDLAERRPAV